MIDFPASPTDGQIFSATNGVVYRWSATYSSWLAQNPAPPLGGTGDFYATGTGGAVPVGAHTPVVPTTINSGNATGSYNVANGRYTPPAGRFSIYGYVAINAAGGTALYVSIWKNGSQVPNALTQAQAAPSTGVSANISATVDANGADYFELRTQIAASTGTFVSIGFGAFPLTGMQGPTGPIGQTQTVFFETGAVATGTTLIPADDTIPQITEGNEFMTLSITPQSATSKLIIDVTCSLANDVATAATLCAALFQDSTANALAVGWFRQPSASLAQMITFKHTMTSGTTSATTFRIRGGCGTAGTTTFNGASATRFYGGVMASSIVIREVP